MTKIALIGDSIRMGYQAYVQAALNGDAEVWTPDINGGDSRNILNHLNVWIDTAHPDIVHINCGLHDLKRSFGTGVPAVPMTEYVHNVQVILSQLSKSVPYVIWATTTPVNSTWHHAVKDFDRFEDDVSTYNDAALKVTRGLCVPVNDLYTAVMIAGRDQLLLPDGVHFTPEGYILLGNQVTGKLIGYLSALR
jgi:lysophospholipase L1-like esterase